MIASGLSARNYTIQEYTKTVCPFCMSAGQTKSDDAIWVDGMLVERDGAIWMRRFCAVHGQTESLYEGNSAIWRSRFGWQTPTLEVTPDRASNASPFPNGYAKGLPIGHGQHTCLLLLNVTKHCNYRCPTCYADALEPGATEISGATIDEIERTVDTVLERENGRLGVLMLSGGEPTVRKDLPEILLRMKDKPITRIMLNTNGRRFSKDDRLLQAMSELTGRAEVYLQFDGITPEPYIALRGEDVLKEKMAALDRLDQAGVFTTLVMTVKRGVNEDQVGDVILAGRERRHVAGVAIQPVFGSGRDSGIDHQDRTTPTSVLHDLGVQTNGALSAGDFIPLPCSHRDCCDIAYYIRDRKDDWKSIVNLVGRDELKRWIHMASNTISFDNASEAVKSMIAEGTLQRIFSEQKRSTSLGLAADLFRMCDCVPGVHELLTGLSGAFQERLLKQIADRTFRVTVKMFMDAHTFHEHRIRQCCVHVGTYEDDPRRYSFCWRWLFTDADDFPNRNANGMLPLEVKY